MNYLMTGDYSYVQKYVGIGHPDIPPRNECDEGDFLRCFPKDSFVIFYGKGRFSKKLILRKV